MIDRFIYTEVLQALSEARAVCLLGARQTGKSTLIEKIASELDVRVYRLDEALIREEAANDPVGFIAGKRAPVVIDEIQLAPELLNAIKLQVDRSNDPGQFLLTGSANLIHLREVSDALPGRIQYLTLHPFSQGEIHGKCEKFLDQLFSSQLPEIASSEVGPRAYLEELIRGGYPEVQRRKLHRVGPFFTSYIDSLLGRDLDSAIGHFGGDRSLLGNLIDLIAARSGAVVNYSALANDLKVSDKTVCGYLDILENLYLVQRLQSWSRNLGQRVVKAPKLYLNDSGMLAARLGLTADMEITPQLGPLYETFVIGELTRQISYSVTPQRLFYYRDVNKREIDLIVERPGQGVVALEVKAAATLKRKDFRHLRFLRDRLGDHLKGAAVIYTGAESIEVGDRVGALPLSALWV